MTAVPGARDVREEDTFDVARVADWIRAHAATPDGLDGEPEVRQFTGGASNLTYLLRFPGGRDLIVRRAPQGTKAKGAHDMHREYVIQSALAPVFDYVAPMVAFCDDADVVGGDFYAMDRIVGVIPRSEWPDDTPLSPEQARALCLDAVDVLAELHGIDLEAAGLADLGKGAGYVRRQVEGWSTRYRNAHTEDVPDLESVMAWLDEHQPDDVATCLIHNDFKLDNLVLDADDPTTVVGVLDWEMATLGDPLMDLAGSMAYWVQADDTEEFQMMRRVPTHLPGMLTRDEFVAAYVERTGLSRDPGTVALLRGLRPVPDGRDRPADLLPLLPRPDHQRDVRPLRLGRADHRPPARRPGRARRRGHRVSRILLVRHGQASFGADDYDNLSPTGHEQSRVLGAALAARGLTADVVVAGEMKRHAQTAAEVLDGSGWTADVTVDAGWNEFDHLQVLAVHDQPTTKEGESEKVAFQRWFEEATLRWTSGAPRRGLRRVVLRLHRAGRRRDGPPGRRPRPEGHRRRAARAAVRSPGRSPPCWPTTTRRRTDLWLRLNPVSINTGVSTVVCGSRGTTLVSFNAHDHLFVDGSADLLTYR